MIARRRAGLAVTLTLATTIGLGIGLGLSPTPARADVIDDAYAAGNEAARNQDWAGAIEAWQGALELLPGRSAQLDYDLGTAYAQLGELGRATYHLERALQPEARPSVEVAEAARRNLGIVRRQAEVQAEISDARISREANWWELVVEVLAGQALAWISLVSAWLLVATIVGRRWRSRRDRDSDRHSDRHRDRTASTSSAARSKAAGSRRGIADALVLVFALVLVIGGGLHALAIGSSDEHPDAIALDLVTDVREGPGAHLPVAFDLQGGSHVRILDERAGWARIRLPGGLEGWVREDAVARLDQPPTRTGVRADRGEATSQQI